MPLSWEEKISMAKEANPNLTDEQAEEVIHDLQGLAELALEQYFQSKRKIANSIMGSVLIFAFCFCCQHMLTL